MLLFVFFPIISFLLLLICLILCLYINYLQQSLRLSKFQKIIKENESYDYRNKLLEKVREKIAVTQRAENKFIKGEDLVAECIYRQSNIDQLGTDIRNLFEKQLGTLKTQYPSLTDLDILVIVLLGIGMDNVEICALLHMEKRTLYRRRQLIAQRIGISSLSIEEFALHLLEEEE